MSIARQLLKPFKPLESYAPAIVQNWSHRRLADLDIDPKPFEGFSTAIRPLMMEVAATRFFRYDEHYASKTHIPGWLSPKERQILYALARWLPGPITEIGSWCGLSTAAIARGIKDSCSRKEFRTYDLVLTEDQFIPMEGGRGLFLPNDPVSHGLCTEESFQNDILPNLTAPGGTNGVLKCRLKKLGLLDLVKIFVGDFREATPVVSRVLFCDCLHDEHEINENAPALRSWLSPGSILACHDVGGGGVGKTDLITSLRKKIPLGYGVVIDSTYIAEAAV